MSSECFSFFFFTSGPTPVLFPDEWWFLSEFSRFSSALIARFNLFFVIGHLSYAQVYYILRSSLFSGNFSFIADEYSILISEILLVDICTQGGLL